MTLIWASANRDETVFGDPDGIPARSDPSQNLLLRGRHHVCPGAPLARLELRIIMEELLARTREIALVPGRPPTRAVYHQATSVAAALDRLRSPVARFRPARSAHERDLPRARLWRTSASSCARSPRWGRTRSGSATSPTNGSTTSWGWLSGCSRSSRSPTRRWNGRSGTSRRRCGSTGSRRWSKRTCCRPRTCASAARSGDLDTTISARARSR